MLSCSEGHPIPPDAPESLCPRCLLDLVTQSSGVTRVGPFRLLEALGEGGFGRVYRAQREGQSHTVALKLLRHLEHLDEESVVRFRKEPMICAALDPRYVVQVLETGEHDSVPYFTMEHMPGGTLRERISEFRGAPQHAARVMIRIAEAVQYLHWDPERPLRAPILHRDLKPENILFGADGEPRLSDFGIAKLTTGTVWALSRTVGCPAYMAPEQLYPTARRELTAAADVYALGAILYELLTGRPPFTGTDPEILAQLRDDEPTPPRRWVPQLDRFLETVVLNALEKDPSRRYRSAGAFAQDLGRALQGKPPEEAPVVPTGVWVRSWLKRRPLQVAFAAWLLALLVVLGFGLHATLSGREEALQREQQTNSSIAAMQAVAVNLQLRAYEARISQLARDPAVVALFDQTEVGNPSKVLLERRPPFDNLVLLSPAGHSLARTSRKSAEYLKRSFAFRDYFKGAEALAREACAPGSAWANAPRAFVARAHLSESDGHFELAVSTPICRGGAWLGLLAGTVSTDNVLGAVRVSSDPDGRVTAVLGPRDRDRANAERPLPVDLSFIVHPGLIKGQLVTLLQPEPAAIRAALGLSLPAENHRGRAPERLRYAAPYRVDTYRDPVPGYGGTWAATFATADESGYIVAVASRRDETPLASAMLGKLALPAGVPFSITFLGLVSWAVGRNARARRYLS